jgi:hypothetical protein
LGLWTAVGGGCVTDTISFHPEPVGPPIIESSPTFRTKINDTFWVDANDGPEWTMEVVVRDKDPDRELLARYRIYVPSKTDLRERAPQFEQFTVPKGSVEDPEERTLPFKVPTTALEPDTCHRLELVVSGSFDPKQSAGFWFDVPRETVNEHDIDAASWQVWEGDPLMPASEKLVTTCAAEVLVPGMIPIPTGDER